MYLKNISVSYFRNLEHIEIEPHPSLNVIHGQNAQGKTNFLEALFYLSWGKGFRTSKKDVLLAWSKPEAQFKVSWVQDDALEEDMSASLSLVEKKWHFRARDYKSARIIREHFKVICFTPDSTSLFRTAPSHRRKYFDRCISNINGSYAKLLRKYERCLAQRNSILKKGGSSLSLESFTEELIPLSLYLDQERRKFIEIFLPFWKKRAEHLGQFDWEISLEYSGKFYDLEDYRKAFLQKASLELLTQVTALGAHKEDYLLKLDGIAALDRASQGQHRVLVIAFILALMDLLKEKRQQSPIFLLDDLGSELDQERIRNMISEIMVSKSQCFISCTDPSPWNSEKALFFEMKAGKFIS